MDRPSEMKLTKAQRAFLLAHKPNEMLPRFPQYKTYDFLGRLRDLGMIEIIDGKHSGWPYTWDGTRLTDAGRSVLSTGAREGRE